MIAEIRKDIYIISKRNIILFLKNIILYVALKEDSCKTKRKICLGLEKFCPLSTI